MGRLSGVKPRLSGPAAPNVSAPERKSARQRGYTTRWDKASAAYRRAHPVCLGCEAMELVGATEVTDHVIPHKGDRRLMWDPANWQPACRWHHDVVKQLLEEMFEAGRIGAEDLRLDSAMAIDVSRRALQGEGGSKV